MGQRVLQAIAGLADIVDLVDEIEEGEQAQEAGQHEEHRADDLAGDIAADHGHAAALRPRHLGRPQRASDTRRQNITAATASRITWISQTPTPNGSRPCTTQA